MAYFTEIATQMGISLWLLIIILVWTAIWKLLGLWKSARNNHPIWFVALALINTVGILPILYIYVFSGIRKKEKKHHHKKTIHKKKRK